MRGSLSLRFCLALCGLLVSAPFLNPFHSYPLLTFYTEWLAFAIGLAALAAIAMVPSGAGVPVPAICVGLFLLTALLVLQAALGQVAYPLRSATGALYAIWAGLLAMLGAWLRSELGEAAVSRALQAWVAAAGLLAAASGFVQYYHLPLPAAGAYVAAQPINAMFGTVNQPNNFADYLGCAVISVAFLHARNALSLLPALLVALPLAAGMALSGSRGSWGYLAIALALVPLLRLGGHSREAKRILQVACFALAVFLLVQILNLYTGIFVGPEGRPSSSGERLIRYLEIGGTGERPIRLQLFLYAWLMFLSNPLLGVGFGEYAWRAFELSAELGGSSPPGLDRHSHNLFLQLLAETGIAGLLCVAIPLVSWFWRMPWRSLTPDRCWMIGVLAVIGLHSMVEFPLWHANFLGMFALLFGAASSGGATVTPTRLRRGLLLVVVLAGGLTARGVWSDYRSFERWYLAVETNFARGGTPGSGDLDDLMKLREGSLFGPYFERIASEAIAIDEEGLGDKLALNTQVMRAYPMPSVVLRQVALLALSGRDADARRTLRAAATLYPQWTREWLPTLEKLAGDRPARFSGLLDLARARLGDGRP
ncbi:MAG TPA: Wzy polymerase domain-containing protein [Burkholderiales bacterium]|nr:Wzy polymerase domain-containing protein [Burkholderiales bacterium]